MAGYIESQGLITDFNNKERRAFDALYDHYYTRIFFFCCSLVDNREDAQDITLDTLNKLFLKYSDFQSLANITAFLYITSRNSCFDYLRRRKTEIKGKAELARTLDEAVTNTELLDFAYFEALKKMIDQLPPRQGTAIELRYFRQLKFREIAAIMGITPQGVENLVNKGLASLRGLLEAERPAEVVMVMFTALIPFLR